MSEVTVVIPNWNGARLIGPLLGRLRSQTHPIEEILLVDNGSTDKSVEAARSEGARVVEMGRNAGFSPAVNRGIKEARTAWVAVINNDVEPAPDWLEQLMNAGQRPRVWYAAGKLLSQSRRDALDGTFDTLCRGACAWRAGQDRRDGPLWGSARRVRFVPFTATLFRKELFHKIGFLDERFESYLEDVDFCLRCAMHGYSGLYVPEAVAWHAGSATLGRWHKDVVRRISRNQLLLVAKHYPVRSLVRYSWSILVAQLLWGLVALRHGRGLSYLRGKAEGLWMFRGARRSQRKQMHPRRLARILEQSEAEMFKLQRRSGFDLYWRLYFLLTCLS